MIDYNFRAPISRLYDCLFKLATKDIHVAYRGATQKQVAQAKADRIPASIITYAKRLNGIHMQWTAHKGGTVFHVHLLPLDKLYGPSREGEIYFGLEGEDPRLRVYRPLDRFADAASVGLLHDERRSPELYHYNIDDELLPTGVDLPGYFELLELTLGWPHWQSLLVQLASPAGQARPFRVLPDVHGNMIDELLAGLPQLVPSFSLEQFVARYDAVKLPR
ncbi:hypothetical protein Q5H93_03475 [Hymenobacter sp. ASUV-10]|uniref:Uncharacterized protein n=1 Tax=Hymenobacter aranciens TaxID=3063996 RepID=A0ABT9B680_9BACT|nr:hypothetical protein [Hymenobacter sp. ASUV-10]MDO7873779.1 hypothetical protein [Hymenobacter sp. ASUV-10]